MSTYCYFPPPANGDKAGGLHLHSWRFTILYITGFCITAFRNQGAFISFLPLLRWLSEVSLQRCCLCIMCLAHIFHSGLFVTLRANFRVSLPRSSQISVEMHYWEGKTWLFQLNCCYCWPCLWHKDTNAAPHSQRSQWVNYPEVAPFSLTVIHILWLCNCWWPPGAGS